MIKQHIFISLDTVNALTGNEIVVYLNKNMLINPESSFLK